MNQKDYGKNFSITYDANIAELSKSSFKLPNTKKATGSFKLKLKKEQAVSLTPKIGSQSFAVKNVPQGQFITKDQIKIESFATRGAPEINNVSGVSLSYFKNKFYLFHRFADTGITNTYFSSTDGINWTNEGKPHANYVVDRLFSRSPLSVVYDDKLWVYSENKLFSATDPNGTNFQEVTLNGGITFSVGVTLVVIDNKMWLRNEDQLYSSTNGSDWTAVGPPINDRSKQIILIEPISLQEKIYTLGGKDKNGNTINKVYSLSNTGVLKEEATLGNSAFSISTEIFAGGIVGIGGNPSSKNLSYSLNGNDWKTLNVNSDIITVSDINSTTLVKENEIWGINRTDPPTTFKITLQNLD